MKKTLIVSCTHKHVVESIKAKALNNSNYTLLSDIKRRIHWLYGFVYRIKLNYTGIEQLGLTFDEYYDTFREKNDNGMLIVRETTTGAGFEIG